MPFEGEKLYVKHDLKKAFYLITSLQKTTLSLTQTGVTNKRCETWKNCRTGRN